MVQDRRENGLSECKTACDSGRLRGIQQQSSTGMEVFFTKNTLCPLSTAGNRGPLPQRFKQVESHRTSHV